MNYKHNLFTLFCTIVFSTIIQSYLSAQSEYKQVSFGPPLDIPMFLSGNFGELRSTHFHTGIDIKTNGEIGTNVLAIEDGYISRIKIQSGGYGNAIYITHYNGFTSVYGHLHEFRKDIQEYTIDNQYRKQSFEINLFPPKDKFILKKGEVFAISGNTGRSGGPHLHFEIRNTASSEPINPLLFGFDIADDISPKLYNLAVYPLSEGSHVDNKLHMCEYPLIESDKNTYRLKDQDTIKAWGEIGFGIHVNDFLNGSNNRCGVFSIELEVDKKLVYQTDMSSLSFSESRYILSHIDYATYLDKHRKYQKAFIDPNNKLSIYQLKESNGIVNFNNEDSISNIKFKLDDTYKNKSELGFFIEQKPMTPGTYISQGVSYIQAMPFMQTNDFSSEGIQLSFPENCFFDNLFFNYSYELPDSFLLSGIHHVHTPSTPLYKRYEIAIKPEIDIADTLESKLLIASVDTTNGLQITGSVGGELVDSMVVSTTRSFGSFAVLVDTVPPTIEAVQFISDKATRNENLISFKINDDLAGLKDYQAFIDNQWMLFRYDAKNDLIFYLFTDNNLNKNSTHELRIELEDNVGNKTILVEKFYW